MWKYDPRRNPYVLLHYGVGHDKGGHSGRYPWGSGKKGSTKSNASSIIKTANTQIGRSLGAKPRNYHVTDPETHEQHSFVEGTKIQNSQVFAGKGCSKKLRPEVVAGLSAKYGGEPSGWQHCKGIGVLDYDGEHRKAEVHWFQEKTAGKHRFKVKKWLD